MDCCENKKDKSIKQGIIYGLIPHTGCIAFIIFSVLGVTTATAFFKPLMMSKYFFYGLIGLSFVFATVSALIYLRKQGMLHKKGIKQKWKYLSILYGTTIGVNLILFLLVFPIATNITTASGQGTNELTLSVDIPCSGHAPLISGELEQITNVKGVNFRFPNYFDISYDGGETTKSTIMELKIFDTYPAELEGGFEIVESSDMKSPIDSNSGCGSCGGCSGGCDSSTGSSCSI